MSKINYKIVTKGGPILSGLYWIVKDLATGNQFKVIGYPFENCQTWLISAFKYVASYKDPKEIMDRIREIKDLTGVGQTLCQIDVRRELFLQLEPYLKIHAKMEYVNTTGSHMVNLLIDTRL